ncbi:hypothetical protein CEXT_443641 [Caerostris extrusa]|uniref:Uncharacterized protein n=1 Tax=Caerostris extrusa TaxID=172846 RepID=A0AAV4XRE6_CAEEX|nr:hypothetical protein CEXT_443641 [Caerostris extrusa]
MSILESIPTSISLKGYPSSKDFPSYIINIFLLVRDSTSLFFPVGNPKSCLDIIKVVFPYIQPTITELLSKSYFKSAAKLDDRQPDKWNIALTAQILKNNFGSQILLSFPFLLHLPYTSVE